ncbi:YidC/Oxa1 family membrane protein insertase [Agromyces sp. Leaf222]|uniref:YidC/Oxa1 family membrane protein insertase n=1 Tax=Agromyces sp. Leaf222 TaxID=1735688 RepID=UPI0006F50D9C|nr:YidC/Oxa1 family membrane protein insertase [Agromyces sp. Leaf222]KQM81527.1 preprotein translocase YidC [Agromyces sp. Leaf222]
MDLYAFPPIAAVLDVAYSLLMSLSNLLEPIAGASSAALAIVLVTLLVRAALIPVGVSQAKAERTRARLAPRLAELQRKHKANPERLQREMMALYAEEGTSPFAGCLPMLVQIPVVGVIYALFILPVIAGQPNDLLTHTLFGVPLGSSLAGSVAAGTATPATIAVFAAIVLLIALVGEVTRRAFRPVAAAGAASAQGASDVSTATSAAAGQLPGLAGMQGVLGLLQFVTAVVAMFVPLAAAVYLLVTVTWTLGQRLVLRRRYPAVPPVVPPALPA